MPRISRLIVVTNTELSYNDAFGPVFPGADPRNPADQQMDDHPQFDSPSGSLTFGSTLSINDQLPANHHLSPDSQSSTSGQLAPYGQLSFRNYVSPYTQSSPYISPYNQPSPYVSPYTQPPSHAQSSFQPPHDNHAAENDTQGTSMAHPEMPEPEAPEQEILEPETSIKEENSQDANSPKQNGDADYDPNVGGDDSDYKKRSTKQGAKKRKLNKDGRSRKVRQPRGHLRRWDENDLMRSLLGIVWACGESGTVIPFEQAAKLVDPTCTASALQQAILKMQTKLNSEGAQIPKIKMNWPKKNESIAGPIRDNGKVPRKKPTMVKATQCKIISLGGSTGQHTLMNTGFGTFAPQINGLPAPMNILAAPVQTVPGPNIAMPGLNNAVPGPSNTLTGPSNIANAQNLAAQPSSGPGMASGLVAPTQSGRQSRRRTHAMMSREDTPPQPQLSPVCPPAPRRIRTARRADASPSRRLFPEPIASPSTGLSSFQFGRMNRSAHTRAQPSSTMDAGHSPFMPFNTNSRHGGMQMAAPQGSWDPTPFNFSGFERNIGFTNGIQDSDHLSGSSRLFNSDSATYNLSTVAGPSQERKAPFDTSRKDSMFPSNSQSIASSQQSRGPQTPVNQGIQTPTGQDQVSYPFMYSEQGIRQQNENYISRINAAAAECHPTAWPTRPTPGLSRHQPRPRMSLGLDTLANPFGGNFDDIFQAPPARAHQNIFGETEAMSSPNGSALLEGSGETPADNDLALDDAETEPHTDDGIFGNAPQSPVMKSDFSSLRHDFAGAFNMR